MASTGNGDGVAQFRKPDSLADGAAPPAEVRRVHDAGASRREARSRFTWEVERTLDLECRNPGGNKD